MRVVLCVMQTTEKCDQIQKSTLLKVSNVTLLVFIFVASIMDFIRGGTLLHQKGNVTEYLATQEAKEKMTSLEVVWNSTGNLAEFNYNANVYLGLLEHTLQDKNSLAQQMLMDYAATLIETALATLSVFTLGVLLMASGVRDMHVTPFFLISAVWSTTIVIGTGISLFKTSLGNMNNYHEDLFFARKGYEVMRFVNSLLIMLLSVITLSCAIEYHPLKYFSELFPDAYKNTKANVRNVATKVNEEGRKARGRFQQQKPVPEDAGPRSDYSFMQVHPDNRDDLANLLEGKVQN